MKKLFLSLGLATITGLMYANPVNIQTAQTVASNFMSNHGTDRNAVLKLTKTFSSTASSSQAAFYLFDINNGSGFVIIAGDDAVQPVLAYSAENSFPAQITNKEVTYWLNGYNEQISYVIEHQIPAASSTATEWASLIDANINGNTGAKPTGVTDVAPILLSKWDQMNPAGNGSDNTLYNNLCPTATPTGCVATAMAQIMYFWKKPIAGVGSSSYSSSQIGGSLSANYGSTTYDWADMPTQLTNASSSTQKNAVATLMFHCGVSVDMNYDLAANGGSGAFVVSNGGNDACSQHALVNYFSYKSTIKGLNRGDYADTQWVKILKFELDNGRPILYTGYGSDGGHAFDFDGYLSNGYFHINWGWSGLSNGYFSINNLAPSALGVGGGAGNFNSSQQALIMIEPAASTLPSNPYYNGAAPTAISNISLSESNIVCYPNPAKDFVMVDWKLFNGTVKSIQLYNVVGQRVFSNETTVSAKNINVPVNQLSKGTYILNILTDKGNISTKISIQ